MLGITSFWLFLITGIILNITPGTDTIYIMSRSISQGKLAGVYSVLGVSTGVLVHTMLAAFGLSIILTQSVLLFTAIKLIGAAYLIYLGIRMLWQKGSALSKEIPTKEHLSFRKIYMQGVMSNVLNPKVALFFISLLPQFVATDNPYGPIPFLILGLTISITGTVWCLFIAYFSSFATTKLRENPKIESMMNKLTGIVFIGLGISLMKTKSAS
ncbi:MULTISPECIES: LysE family translocator [Bacillus]|uniref:Homoserine lactone transporter n=2 Tax=Bacillus TaxID=1386 RepID=A0A0M4FRU0_9BACI|nr:MULTISPECIES: LysE family translocator [Bacillus]ALC80543.1 homoserine lactone transporter [Bacillus gobiensis]MBP1083621.1 RhtB (resistance to homoserine/threonine) family protein [Bacillus capparidis]MED1094814.1 LysE family translocator [Bacillus capparidis]